MPSRNRSRSKNTDPASPAEARQHALRLLAGRDYTAARLRDKLARRGFEEAAIAQVLQQLEVEGWIGDRRFAERFAEAAVESGRCFGPRLKLELRRRGVPDEVIGEVLTPLLSRRDEGQDLQALISRRFPGFSSASDDREKRRVIGFLQRRGFSAGAVFRVLRENDFE